MKPTQLFYATNKLSCWLTMQVSTSKHSMKADKVILSPHKNNQDQLGFTVNVNKSSFHCFLKQINQHVMFKPTQHCSLISFLPSPPLPVLQSFTKPCVTHVLHSCFPTFTFLNLFADKFIFWLIIQKLPNRSLLRNNFSFFTF